MKDLKIQIGDIISSASGVVFITVPPTEITSKVFSKITAAKEKKIEQLIIRQMAALGEFEDQEGFEVPDEIQELNELKSLWITGNVSSLPSWIGNMNTLRSLTVTDSSLLMSLPSSIGNLSNLTSLNLSRCYSLESLPSSIGNLSHLTSFDLNGCTKLRSLPENIGNLCTYSPLLSSPASIPDYREYNMHFSCTSNLPHFFISSTIDSPVM